MPDYCGADGAIAAADEYVITPECASCETGGGVL